MIKMITIIKKKSVHINSDHLHAMHKNSASFKCLFKVLTYYKECSFLKGSGLFKVPGKQQKSNRNIFCLLTLVYEVRPYEIQN